MTSERFLEVKQAADRVGLSPSTVRSMCAEGEFPNAIDVGSRTRSFWKIPESDLAAWIERRRARARFPAPDDAPDGADPERSTWTG